MLRKKARREAVGGHLAAAIDVDARGQAAAGTVDRRSFLRNSGLAIGGITAGAALLGPTRIRKAEAAAPTAAGAKMDIKKSVCTHCSVGCNRASTVRSISARIAPRALPCVSTPTATVASSIR